MLRLDQQIIQAGNDRDKKFKRILLRRYVVSWLLAREHVLMV